MGFVRDKFLGGDEERAAKNAGKAQVRSGEDALKFQKDALDIIRTDLQPFRDAGVDQLAKLASQPLQDISFYENLRSNELAQRVSRVQTFQAPGEAPEAFGPQGQAPTTFQDVRNPEDAINSPFFQQIADETSKRIFSNRAAGGKLGSGGTAKLLQDELFLKSNEAANQQLMRDQSQAQQQFGQQFGGRQLTAAEQAQGFGQQVGGRQLTAGEQEQQFGQDISQAQVLDSFAGSAMQRNLAPQQQRFNQLFDLTRMGQTAAAQQAVQQGATANQLSDITQGIGNVRAGAIVGGQAARSQGLGNTISFFRPDSFMGGSTGGAMGGSTAGGGGAQGGSGSSSGAASGAMALMSMFSDVELKENITYVGDNNGIPWFKFDYIDGEKDQFGTMAQLIEDDYPEAVTMVDGYRMVNYGVLPCQH